MKKIKSVFLVIITAIFLTGCSSSSNNTFTDKRDGKVYKTVKIGNQVWMAENLAYKPDEGNFWAYDYDESHVATYGYLYDWKTALNVCPDGWHLPSDDEWKELEMYLGMSQIEANETGFRGTDEGGKLKETDTIHWDPPNTGATNSTGFTCLPGGHFFRGKFYHLNYEADFWSSSEDGSFIRHRNLNFDDSKLSHQTSKWFCGFSVRCLRDNKVVN